MTLGKLLTVIKSDLILRRQIGGPARLMGTLCCGSRSRRWSN